jgi:GAF domain-containing protein
MKPIPESEAALDEYLSFGDVDIREELLELGQRTRSIVPELVGLSLTVVEDGVTFTLVASDEGAAAIDLTQYVDGGPCQEGMEIGQVVQVDIDDLFDEQRWLSYARASAAHGVASSLSLPVLQDGEPVLGINLYASTPGAFEGRQEELAAALGASATHIVTNADLPFRTRLQAARALELITEQRDFEVGVGVLAAHLDITVQEATEQILNLAARAGVAPAQAGRVLRQIWRLG